MRKFKDIESNKIVTEDQLKREFAELQKEQPDFYGDTTFEQYINNCLTRNNGTLKEVKPMVERIRQMECVFDAATVVWGLKNEPWFDIEDSRIVFEECTKIAEFYEAHYPADDPDYLDDIEELTITWFKDECGVSLTEEEETYLFKIQRIAKQIRRHIPEGWDKYDYDFWGHFEYVLGEQITDTEYHHLNGRIDNPLELDKEDKAMIKEMLEDFRHPKKTYLVELKEYLSVYRIVKLKAASGKEALKTACEKLKAGEFKAVFKDIKLEELDFDDMELLDVTEEE